MKKNSIYALMSAIALAGAVGFTSCSADDKVVENPNPGYDPVKNEVPVEFLFNVGSYGSSASTRQSVDAAQAYDKLPAGKFRGIDNTRILCFEQSSNGKYIPSHLRDGGEIDNDDDHIVSTKMFDMARVLDPGSLGYSNETDYNSTRVLEMTFPLGTNTMIFYGKAIRNSSDNYKDIYGHLDEYTVDEDLTKVTFALGKRLSSEQKTEFEHIQNLLAGILTCVMETNRGNIEVLATDVPETGIKPYGYTIATTTATDMKWKAYYDNYISAVSPAKPLSPVDNNIYLTELEIKLAKAYMEMTTIQEAELRNGSGPALLSTIKQLWGIVNSVRCATPTSLPEAVAKYMAHRIHTELERYFEATFGESAKIEGLAPSTVSFKNTSETLIPNIKTDIYWPVGSSQFPSDAISGITSTNNNLNTFPANFNLPQGSTHIKFNRNNSDENMPAGTPTDAFYYVQDYNSSAVGGEAFTVDDYYFPAELLYFGNSPIRVSDQPHKVKEYPQNTTDWMTELSENPSSSDPWFGWTANGSVSHTTRSVAMTNNINYGTALLKMTVGYASSTLNDNNHEIQRRDYGALDGQEPDNVITPTATSFKLVGVVIGGQSPRIGWNMLPALNDGERKGYIFDDDIAITSIPITGVSDPNYTMVFDNYNASLAADAQEKVFIALEFQNNTGMDFFGKDNMIANGSNFYLIGQLDPNGKTAPNLPDYHALPPYGMTGSTTVPRVFIQDHKTMVNFKIGENSLKYAYLTVPDLRSSSVTLGLSVDMSWSAGLDFGDVELGGTE